MSNDDPLDGADIGETRTVTNTEDIWLGRLEHETASGTDRLSDPRVDGVAVVTNEYGDQMLRVTVESDVTKRLPHAWDTASEPRTDTERQAAQRSKWVGRGISALTMAATIGVGVAILNRVFSRLEGEVMLSGELVTAPTGPELLPGVLLVLLLAALVMWAIRVLPRPGPGVGR